MRKIFLVLICCFAGMILQAQKCNINRAWAYYTMSYPGVQMADEDGNPIPPKPIIDRFIYIEWCGSKKPETKEVEYNGHDYDVVLEKVSGRSVVPGKDLSPENRIRITASKCRQMWKLILVPKEPGDQPEPGIGKLMIRIKLPGICVFKLSKETKLKTLPRP